MIYLPRLSRLSANLAGGLSLALSFALTAAAQTVQPSSPTTNPDSPAALYATQPWEVGALVQSGFGVTENRNSFTFAMAGVHAGKTLTGLVGPGFLRGSFEYGVEAFPFWQSYTPVTERNMCIPVSAGLQCSAPYKIGGTFTGASITPIILRWNLAGTRRLSFWGQAAGGVLWTNHKYPAFGGPPVVPGTITEGDLGGILSNNGPASDASVWNFTPQGGVGVHWFVKPRRSIDLGANAIHISSASLGDRNPGVNASVQFTLGYTWWK